MKYSKKADFLLKFKIDQFRENSPKESEYDNWSKINLNVLHGDTIYFDFQDAEILTCDEVKDTRNKIKALLNDELEEYTELSFIEPDLKFMLFIKYDIRNDPNCIYVKKGHEIIDIFADMYISFWDSEGALSGHCLQLCLARHDLQAFLCYLQYVTGEEYDKDIFNKYCKNGYLELIL